MAKILTMPVRENSIGRWSPEGKVLEMKKRPEASLASGYISYLASAAMVDASRPLFDDGA